MLIARNKRLWWSHTMVQDFVSPFYFQKILILQCCPKKSFYVYPDNLKLSKLVLTNIPVPSKIKLKTIFEFLTGYSMFNGGI